MSVSQCPLDGCEYESDSPKSLEAHISGKSDDVHVGEVGKEYRDEINGSDGDQDASDDDDDQDGGVEQETESDPVLVPEDDAPAPVAPNPSGVLNFIGENPVVIYLGAAVVVILAVYTLSVDDPAPEPETNEQQETTDPADVPLFGGD